MQLQIAAEHVPVIDKRAGLVPIDGRRLSFAEPGAAHPVHGLLVVAVVDGQVLNARAILLQKAGKHAVAPLG